MAPLLTELHYKLTRHFVNNLILFCALAPQGGAR
jgi:hypothetical protein